MNSIFNLYWKIFGATLSGVKGSIADFAPISLVEILVWIGFFACLITLNNLRIRIGIWRGKIPSEIGSEKLSSLVFFLLGPFLLFLLMSGQRVIPFSPAPTSLRPSLYKTFGAPLLFEPEWDSLIILNNEKLSNSFPVEAYRQINYQNLFSDCNNMLDSVILKLGLPKGRRVSNIKQMMGITRILGTAYGGPAYHDPLTSEVAWISQKEFPTTTYWRIQAACHEIAHAKGFTREMDAEILTYLALSSSKDPLYQSMGTLLWLQKSGSQFDWPGYLERERQLKHNLRKKVQLKQPLVRLAIWINEKLGFKNTPAKYGSRSPGQSWNPGHPFFSTVHHLSVKHFSPKWEIGSQ